MNLPFYSPLSREKRVRHWKVALSKRNKKIKNPHTQFLGIFLEHCFLSASGKEQKFVSKLAKHFIVHSEC